MMNRKYRLQFIITVTFLTLVLLDCSEDYYYEYFETYTGDWQFRVYRRSWGGYGGQYDTIYYFGSISKLSDNRGLQINYLEKTSAFVWVENDTIIYEIGKIGKIKDGEIQFAFIRGSMATGTSDYIYGVKKVTTTDLNEVPIAVTSPATGVTLTGSMLRGIVNARSLSVDVEFEYGISENYGNTAKALPDKAECDMEIRVKAYISGLEPSTQYHFRTKVVSSAGTVYGDDMTFTTTGYSDPVTDSEGNVYKTIQIGTQLWMAENLKSTKNNNGDTIPYIQDNASMAGLRTGAYCYYNNDASSYKDIYGALYNFYAIADDPNLCPSGWHVPGSTELADLLIYLYPNSAARLKESGTSHWKSPNSGSDNSSGFTALPGGTFFHVYYQFSGIGDYGYWWSSDSNYYSARCLKMSSLLDYAWLESRDKALFYSVRCIKD